MSRQQESVSVRYRMQPEWSSEREVSRRPLTVHLAGLALIVLLTPLHDVWAVQVLLVPLLLIIPGVILLRALRIDGEAVAMNPVYVPAASMIVLLVSALAVDFIGPLVGISAPLRAAPLLISLLIVCAALLAGSLDAPAGTAIPWGSDVAAGQGGLAAAHTAAVGRGCAAA